MAQAKPMCGSHNNAYKLWRSQKNDDDLAIMRQIGHCCYRDSIYLVVLVRFLHLAGD